MITGLGNKLIEHLEDVLILLHYFKGIKLTVVKYYHGGKKRFRLA